MEVLREGFMKTLQEKEERRGIIMRYSRQKQNNSKLKRVASAIALILAFAVAMPVMAFASDVVPAGGATGADGSGTPAASQGVTPDSSGTPGDTAQADPTQPPGDSAPTDPTQPPTSPVTAPDDSTNPAGASGDSSDLGNNGTGGGAIPN